MNKKIKIAFLGTPDFAGKILKGIINSEKIKVDLVVSQADKPVGRKREILPTPVKKVALDNNIKILQPLKLKNNLDFLEELKSLDLDFLVVVAYGKILPKILLNISKYGAINIHGSLLPLYRGASPIQESIKNGDTETGLTTMYMSEGMDEGDILKIGKVKIDIVDKTPDIFDKFIKIGPDLLIDTLESIVDNSLKSQAQIEKNATYCTKINKEDGLINFKKETAQQIYNKFRAYTPWPGIYTYYKGKKLAIEDCFFEKINPEDEKGKIIKLENLKIGIICKEGVLILKKIKLEGKKSLNIKDFLNGAKDFIGSILG